MRIFLQSDLHVEFDQDFCDPPPDTDLIVLAGDIDHGSLAAATARWYQATSGAPVILIAGNHEFYGSDIEQCFADIRDEVALMSKVHFLENETVIIDGVRFLGCTLWSNFKLLGSDRAGRFMDSAKDNISDFWYIKHKGRRLQPEDIAEWFRASYEWLDRELAKPFDGKTVVITHFSPHRAAIHPRFLEPDADSLTPYFNSDCSQLMRRHSIDVWMFGHTHQSVDKIVERNTRLVSNQQGYPSEAVRETGFDPEKIIEI